MRSGFRILEHPADVGIEVWGPDLPEVFRQSALGMFSIIVEPDSVGVSERRAITVRGNDIENLLVRWLSELLYVYDGEDFLVRDIEIKNADENRIEASVIGERLRSGSHRLRKDIKAVTYHQLSIGFNKGMWTARVFFDI